MRLDARCWAAATSAVQGGSLAFRLPAGALARVRIRDTVTGETRAETTARGPRWNLRIPADWPSSLYTATFEDATSEVSEDAASGNATPGHAASGYVTPGDAAFEDAAVEGTASGNATAGAPDAAVDGDGVYFAVRAARPGGTAPVLVSVPFLTWQAYNRAGVPGEGLYPTEGPRRALRVSFDRPGGGPAGHWEAPFHRWLARAGYRAEFCSNLDLHDDPGLLARYRLLVVAGHDEYWTREMRDAAEEFVLRGGNIAFFAANTCWWQARLEDGGRTMVCHRDALSDPVTAADPGRATVEWSSAPVSRPENTLTGVGFRRGAGCWENMAATEKEAYTVAFADHWVYEGTGLRDGDAFARGALGYETDAAETEDVGGVPVVTGRDGTPADFVVLATADLRHWREYGQGGHATMGVMRRGRGTVFNAATIGWSGALDDPVVDRITRNILDRLSRTGDGWEPMGGCAGVRSLATLEGLLFAVRDDGSVAVRPLRTQNLGWTTLESAPGLAVLTAPREATPGSPVLLYGLYTDGMVRGREPVPEPAAWADLYPAPPGAVALAPVDDVMYAVTADGRLLSRPLSAARPGPWTADGAGPVGPAGAVALANVSGRLAAVTADGELVTRPPGLDAWTSLGPAPGLRTLTAAAGRLVGGTLDGRLMWRDLTAADARADHRPDGGRNGCARPGSPAAATYA
ncbi:N,N-dimethylformamidase beta subunit family domain-containing protein [Streptosporangium sandarakinum]